MTPTETGLYGPGDYEGFVTIEELGISYLETYHIGEEFEFFERSAVVTALIELAHDLDARANGQWEIVEGREDREARWHAPTEFSMNRPIRWERMLAGKRPDIYDFGDTIAVWVNEGDFHMANMTGTASSPNTGS